MAQLCYTTWPLQPHIGSVKHDHGYAWDNVLRSEQINPGGDIPEWHDYASPGSDGEVRMEKIGWRRLAVHDP